MDLVTSGGGELDLQTELEETERALREVTLMIEQSQGEVLKLSQRNAAITTHLQQLQNQFDQMPPQEIRNVYDSALDAQQRLFVMRGQLENCRMKNRTWSVSNRPWNGHVFPPVRLLRPLPAPEAH